MKALKKTYTRPQLVEYGRLADLTQGLIGRVPDCFTLFNSDTAPGFLCDTRSS